jgi:hypothetical protein
MCGVGCGRTPILSSLSVEPSELSVGGPGLVFCAVLYLGTPLVPGLGQILQTLRPLPHRSPDPGPEMPLPFLFLPWLTPC